MALYLVVHCFRYVCATHCSLFQWQLCILLSIVSVKALPFLVCLSFSIVANIAFSDSSVSVISRSVFRFLLFQWKTCLSLSVASVVTLSFVFQLCHSLNTVSVTSVSFMVHCFINSCLSMSIVLMWRCSFMVHCFRNSSVFQCLLFWCIVVQSWSIVSEIALSFNVYCSDVALSIVVQCYSNSWVIRDPLFQWRPCRSRAIVPAIALTVHCFSDSPVFCCSLFNNNNNNGYLERLTRTGNKRLHII